MQITKKEVAKYILLPGIVPRAKELRLNLGWLAYLMALIFSATRILPANHPYVMASRQGTFGVSDILFEAGRNLKGGFRNIDQYLIYASFVLGVILLLGQFALLLFFLASQTAHAAGIPWTGMFSTPVRNNDLALMMLDKVFEVPNMWGSKYNPTSIDQVTVFGHALHRIFAFYNDGMLLIAGLIVLYYIFAVTIETMETGSPFGQRFQEIFVPIRIVLALILLVPLGYGFSAGQLLVFKLADWGSGFATNGWLLFNEKAQTNPLGLESRQLVMLPKTQQIGDLLRFYSLVQSCRAIYAEEYADKTIKPYVIATSGDTVTAYDATGLDYGTALGYFPNSNIKITFGDKNTDYKKSPGNVKPYCGTIDIPMAETKYTGAQDIQRAYWDLLTQTLWNNQDLVGYGSRKARTFAGDKDGSTAAGVSSVGWADPDKDPEAGFYANVRASLQASFESEMQNAKDAIRSEPEANLGMSQDILNYGWGGAGIWYNKIAQYNGAITSANMSLPIPSSYPQVMSVLLKAKRTTDGTSRNLSQFITTFGNGSSLKDMLGGAGLDNPAKDGQIATFLGDIYNDMSQDYTYGDGTESHDDNVIANMFSMVFGTEGLFDLRGNDQVHPLAKLSALGRGILDRALIYIGGAMIMGGLSGLSGVLDPLMSVQGGGNGLKAAFSGIGSMFTSFATIGISIGVILYYVVPFMPFLYFFFAAGRWVKSIFEAVIGVPLWALAHLRIDGEGIPGPAAANGYYLLLEIMLRPILIVFGLMASVTCFSALAIALDTVFDLVIKNVTGYNPVDQAGSISWQGKEFRRGQVDQFFYTVMYAVLLYLMAMSCFKLIDLIPNGVLRFIGTGVNEFNDRLNLEQEMVYYAGLSSREMAKDIGGAAQQLGQAVGEGAAFPITFGKDMKDFSQSFTPRVQNAGGAPAAGASPTVAPGGGSGGTGSGESQG